MAFQWYSKDLDKGHTGMKASTAISQIDSYIVAESAILEPGNPVIRVDENTVKLPETADIASIIGIVMHSHKEPVTPYYAEGDAVPIMSMGDIYLPVSGDVTAGGTVGIAIADSVVTYSASTASGATALEAMTFMESGSDGDVVRVRIRK